MVKLVSEEYNKRLNKLQSPILKEYIKEVSERVIKLILADMTGTELSILSQMNEQQFKDEYMVVINYYVISKFEEGLYELAV
jgi:transposase-like protein